jgi:DNA-binding GntR family transcriptional regulator
VSGLGGDSRPLREQVADQIRQLIEEGQLQPGARLDREDVLAKRYDVSRHTVRQALQELTAEGLLASSRGQGRVVRSYKDKPLTWHLSAYESRAHHVEAGFPDADQWDTEVLEQGLEPNQAVEVSIVEPSPHVAERLRVTDPGDTIVMRRRIRRADGIPFQLADSFFRESLIRGTLLMKPRNVSAPGGILAAIGHPQTRYRDEITIRMPTKGEASILELPPGTPVAEVTRIGYAQDGTPLRVMVTIAPGDRNTLVYETDAM